MENISYKIPSEVLITNRISWFFVKNSCFHPRTFNGDLSREKHAQISWDQETLDDMSEIILDNYHCFGSGLNSQ